MVKAIKENYNTEVVSKTQYDAHYKLYNGYVTQLNKIDEQLPNNPYKPDANPTESFFRELKKGESYALDGIILHEMYFANISKQDDKDISYRTSPQINKMLDAFGGFDKWSQDFTATAKSARGWTILVFEQRTRTYRNILLDWHDYGNINLSYPLLVLDMYEHAYFYDYLTDKDKYISKFIQNINWSKVQERMVNLIQI